MRHGAVAAAGWRPGRGRNERTAVTEAITGVRVGAGSGRSAGAGQSRGRSEPGPVRAGAGSLSRRHRCRSEPADDGDDEAHDLGVGAVDGLVVLILRQQPLMTGLALEGLDRGLTVEQGRDDLSVVGGVLLAHDDPVVMADGGVDHRIADDLEQEHLTRADDLSRQGEDIVDLLLGQDRTAGGDATDDGNLDSVVRQLLELRPLGLLLFEGIDHFDGPRALRIAADIAETFELRELMGHARQRGESGGLAYLAAARRVAVGYDGAFDGLEGQTLTGSEAEIALTGRTLGNLNLIVITAGGSDLTGNILVARPASASFVLNHCSFPFVLFPAAERRDLRCGDSDVSAD